MSHTHVASVKNLDRNVEDAVQCNNFSCSFYFLIFIINPLHFDIFRPSTKLSSSRQISTRWLSVYQTKQCIIWLYHIPFTYKYACVLNIWNLNSINIPPLIGTIKRPTLIGQKKYNLLIFEISSKAQKSTTALKNVLKRYCIILYSFSKFNRYSIRHTRHVTI